MPALLLLRHAKSDWDADGGPADHLRPLAKRGRRAAAALGRFLAGAEQVPDLAFTSPAARARETLELAMEAGGWSCPVREAASFYGAGSRAALAELASAPAGTELLLAVGHEPVWSELASLLIGGGRLRVPTGALLRIDLDVPDWADIGRGTGTLGWMVVPRVLPGGDRS